MGRIGEVGARGAYQSVDVIVISPRLTAGILSERIMPIEAYALVVMKKGDWNFNGYDIALSKRDDKISFCRIRLVEGRGKLPRWEVVEELSEQKDVRKVSDLAVWMTESSRCEGIVGYYENIPIFSTSREIDDRRVTLKQIQQLFPEIVEKKMPMWMALDYVRDRI